MIPHVLTLHVVSPRMSPLGQALWAACASRVALKFWLDSPTARYVRTTDLVIVDLSNRNIAPTPHAVAALANRAKIWLVFGSRPIDPRWVELARSPNVSVASVASSAGGQPYGDTVAAVFEAANGPTAEEVAALVLDAEPFLYPARQLILLLCRHPWGIRRPRDLSFFGGGKLDDVKRVSASVGFNRVEHLIVCVRALAFEQLSVHRKLPPSIARRIVGIGDPSNLRRHLKRALKRSGTIPTTLQAFA